MVDIGCLEKKILMELALKGKISNISQFARMQGPSPIQVIASVHRLEKKGIVKTVKKGRIVEVFLCRKDT